MVNEEGSEQEIRLGQAWYIKEIGGHEINRAIQALPDGVLMEVCRRSRPKNKSGYLLKWCWQVDTIQGEHLGFGLSSHPYAALQAAMHCWEEWRKEEVSHDVQEKEDKMSHYDVLRQSNADLIAAVAKMLNVPIDEVQFSHMVDV